MSAKQKRSSPTCCTAAYPDVVPTNREVPGSMGGQMTIYVDDVGIPADVTDAGSGRIYKSRRCHLFSDQIDQTELHEFAASIGLKRSWFQPGKALGRPEVHDPVGDHYDLTAGERRQAVAAGAVSVDLRQASKLWSAKRDLHLFGPWSPRDFDQPDLRIADA